MWKPRPAEIYGNVKLSVQASEFNYSTPRVTGLPFEDYQAYEIALMPVAVSDKREWLKPSDIGMDPEYDELFGGDDVGGFVSKEKVEEIRTHLRFRASLNITDIPTKELRAPNVGALPNRKPVWNKKK